MQTFLYLLHICGLVNRASNKWEGSFAQSVSRGVGGARKEPECGFPLTVERWLVCSSLAHVRSSAAAFNIWKPLLIPNTAPVKPSAFV